MLSLFKNGHKQDTSSDEWRGFKTICFQANSNARSKSPSVKSENREDEDNAADKIIFISFFLQF